MDTTCDLVVIYLDAGSNMYIQSTNAFTRPVYPNAMIAGCHEIAKNDHSIQLRSALEYG